MTTPGSGRRHEDGYFQEKSLDHHCHRGGGVDIYIRKTEWYNKWNKKEIESAVTDDYYHPFTAGAYEVEWESDQVTVRYCEGLEIENVKDPATWRGLVIYALS